MILALFTGQVNVTYAREEGSYKVNFAPRASDVQARPSSQGHRVDKIVRTIRGVAALGNEPILVDFRARVFLQQYTTLQPFDSEPN